MPFSNLTDEINIIYVMLSNCKTFDWFLNIEQLLLYLFWMLCFVYMFLNISYICIFIFRYYYCIVFYLYTCFLICSYFYQFILIYLFSTVLCSVVVVMRAYTVTRDDLVKFQINCFQFDYFVKHFNFGFLKTITSCTNKTMNRFANFLIKTRFER